MPSSSKQSNPRKGRKKAANPSNGNKKRANPKKTKVSSENKWEPWVANPGVPCLPCQEALRKCYIPHPNERVLYNARCYWRVKKKLYCSFKRLEDVPLFFEPDVGQLGNPPCSSCQESGRQRECITTRRAEEKGDSEEDSEESNKDDNDEDDEEDNDSNSEEDDDGGSDEVNEESSDEDDSGPEGTIKLEAGSRMALFLERRSGTKTKTSN
ncbi:hypothetical protein B0H63DRAFT_476480, partial [Podospora didyma]